MRNFIYGVLLSAGALLCGCSSSKPAPPKISNDQAPDIFRVDLDTSKGPVVITVTRDWAPLGADRFYNLVKGGFFDGVRFFRVLPRFVIQFGINGDPSISRLWSNLTIPDDPVKQSNRKGMVTFATGGEDIPPTQNFLNIRGHAAPAEKAVSPLGEGSAGS